MFIYNCSARYIMYYTFYIFVFQGPGLVDELIFYAQGLDQSRRTRRSSSGWSHHLVVRRHSQPVSRTTRCSLLLSAHFAANQLVGLLGARFFTNQLVGLFVASSSATLGAYQLSWGLPWWSDLATSHRCAIKLLHAVRIRVLILGNTFGVLIRACQMTSASFQASFL